MRVQEINTGNKTVFDNGIKTVAAIWNLSSCKRIFVNLSFVTAIEGAEAIIKVNNKSYSIEIGEKYIEEVKRQYLHYLAVQGEK